MNAKERQVEINRLRDLLESVKDDLAFVAGEAEEALDNTPENLQGSENFQRSEEKKDLLNEAVSDLEELVDRLDEHQNV
jgi:hypothetical protein